MGAIERIKTIALIFMFFLALYMTRTIFSMENQSEERIMPNYESQEKEKINVYDYIRAEAYYMNLDGLSYTIIYDNSIQEKLWEELMVLIDEMEPENLESNIISIDDYRKAFENIGVKYEMPFHMDKELFFRDESLDIDVSISEVVISLDNNRIYIYDGKNERAYSIPTEQAVSNITEIYETVKSSDYSDYRVLVNNDDYRNVYTSLDSNNVFSSLKVANTVGLSLKDKSDGNKKIAQNIFGEGFNFVNKLVDSQDAEIYMYGYGDKALRFDQYGGIIYIEKFDDDNYLKQDLLSSLELALSNIYKYGYTPNSLYLSSYKLEVDKYGYESYEMCFDYRMKNYIVQNKLGENSIKVVVKGSQVVNLQEDIKRYVASIKEDSLESSSENLKFDKVIDINYVEIEENFLGDSSSDYISSDFVIADILSSVESVKMKYRLDEEDNDIFNPVMEVQILDRVYTFDLTEGNILEDYIKME